MGEDDAKSDDVRAVRDVSQNRSRATGAIAKESKDGSDEQLRKRSSDRHNSAIELVKEKPAEQVPAAATSSRSDVSMGREDAARQSAFQIERKHSGAFNRLLSRTLQTPIASPRASPKTEKQVELSRVRSIAFFDNKATMPKETPRRISKTRSSSAVSVASNEEASFFRQRTLRSPAYSRAPSMQATPRSARRSPPDLPSLDFSKIRT